MASKEIMEMCTEVYVTEGDYEHVHWSKWCNMTLHLYDLTDWVMVMGEICVIFAVLQGVGRLG
jgi:hypothetical protein